jgi:hypothetical protein
MFAAVAVPARAAPEPPPDALGLVAEQDPAAVDMVVDAAADPVPALKYDFVYSALDTEAGNAQPVYAEARLLLTQTQPDEADEDRFHEWLAVPAADIPLAEAKHYLERFEDALDRVERATRRERCVHENPWRKENPFAFELPYLSDYRKLGRLLMLKGKIQIAERDYEGACATLRTGYLMARQISEEPVLISGLVGIAIARMVSSLTEELMRSPDAPNLYWALSGLPSPLVDLRTALSYERNSIFVALPALRTPEKSLVTPKQWADMFASWAGMAGGEAVEPAGPLKALSGQLGVTALLMKMYPDAKAHLIAQGRKAEEVEKMPVPVVCGIYAGDTARRYSDNMGKWCRLPYAEARDGLRGIERDMRPSPAEPVSAMAAMLMPALSRAYEAQVVLDRQVAALRCVEAIRMYAAAHDGELPAALDAIECVPVPPDPVAGQPFTYDLADKTATLSAAPIDPDCPRQGVHYRITIRD